MKCAAAEKVKWLSEGLSALLSASVKSKETFLIKTKKPADKSPASTYVFQVLSSP